MPAKAGVPANRVSHLGSHRRAAGSAPSYNTEDAMGSPARRSTSGSATVLLGPQGHVSTKSPARHGHHLPPTPPAPKCSKHPSPRLLCHCQHKRPHPGRKQKNNQASRSDASSPSPGELRASPIPWRARDSTELGGGEQRGGEGPGQGEGRRGGAGPGGSARSKPRALSAESKAEHL